MSVQDITWISIGTLDDLPRQGSRRLRWNGTEIAVFRTGDDRVFALENRCPHKHGPLAEGIVHGCAVTCPLHNWVIDLQTGRAQGADEGQTRTFPVRLDGASVLLGV